MRISPSQGSVGFLQTSGSARFPRSRGQRFRPATLARLAGMVAHHGFELGHGVGLVFQPELGLGGAAALWSAAAGVDAGLASRRWRGGGRLRAAGAGMSLAGAAVHYIVWPWELRKGVPRLLSAEGLPADRLGWYGAILLGWAGASALALAVDSAPGERRWALLGVLAAPMLVKSARHHFAWVREAAVSSPAWWNRGVREEADPTASKKASKNLSKNVATAGHVLARSLSA